jgi:hypothetical protein
VINGHVFIQIRSGGWREVRDGYIRTRRGWRKLRSRSARIPAAAPVIEPSPVIMAATETVSAVVAAQPEVSRRQWLGKYDVLR